jgi:DNA-binding helix-hairpin-helix protein with protein kinase domain
VTVSACHPAYDPACPWCRLRDDDGPWEHPTATGDPTWGDVFTVLRRPLVLLTLALLAGLGGIAIAVAAGWTGR